MFANCPGDQGSIPVESYQRLKKWYLMPPCLALTTIKWGSRVKWSNPGIGVVPSPTNRCSSYWKGAFGSPSTKIVEYVYIYIYIYIYTHEGYCINQRIILVKSKIHSLKISSYKWKFGIVWNVSLANIVLISQNIFVLKLQNMMANQTEGLNRGLSSNVWWLTSANHVKFKKDV